jgi:hypothetical protein
MVLFFRLVEILIFDLGVAEMYCLTTVLGFGMPPPAIFTDAVLMLGLELFP